MPYGSELSRRAIWLPSAVHEPAKIQQPLAVLPSSRSTAKPGTCSPALTSRVPVAASVRSARALPLYSLANSSGPGSSGRRYDQSSPRIGSGNLPPSFAYIARRRVNRPAMMAMSVRAWPGGSAPFQCHCSQRPLLTMEPSSSAKQLVGRRNTVVWMERLSTSLNSPTLRQNSEVSVASGSMITSHFSRASAALTLALLGNEAIGLKPWQKYPLTLPWYIRSK
ncbi:hypothetical protein D3C76_627520 [compost metagenome]